MFLYQYNCLSEKFIFKLFFKISTNFIYERDVSTLMSSMFSVLCAPSISLSRVEIILEATVVSKATGANKTACVEVHIVKELKNIKTCDSYETLFTYCFKNSIILFTQRLHMVIDSM